MCRPSRPNYNQHHQSIFVNRHISHAIQRFSRQTTSQKAIPGQGTPLKLPSNLESIFPIQTVGTSRPLPSQRLSHLKQSPKPKSIRLHKIPLYRNTTYLTIQQTWHGNRSSTSLLFVPHRHLCCFDTIDHAILNNRLSTMFVISGIALSWIKSYLSSCFFTVNAAGYTSRDVPD